LTATPEINPDAIPNAAVSRPTALRRICSSPAAVVALVVLAAIIVSAAFAPLLAPYDPVTQDLAAAKQPPWLLGGSFDHILGTDNFGRDLLSRIIYGARISLMIGLGCATASTLIGAALGLIAGFFGGPIESVIRTVSNVQFAVPSTAIGIALAAVLGSGLLPVVLVLTLWTWPMTARTVTTLVAQVRGREFVSAARISGLGSTAIIWMHCVRPIVGPVLILWSMMSGVSILAESGLSLVGLGVSEPEFSWGSMLADSSVLLRSAWWVPVFTGGAITVTVVAFSLLGDLGRDLVNPKTSGREATPELY
jgi:peptide/nickel transport system permease protein